GLAARMFVPSAVNLMRPAGLQIAHGESKRSIDFIEAPPHKTSKSRPAQGRADCLSINAVPRRGRVSRAAKGADCKSAGYAFVGSSPTSPTTLKLQKKQTWPPSGRPVMLRHVASRFFQAISIGVNEWQKLHAT